MIPPKQQLRVLGLVQNGDGDTIFFWMAQDGSTGAALNGKRIETPRPTGIEGLLQAFTNAVHLWAPTAPTETTETRGIGGGF